MRSEIVEAVMLMVFSSAFGTGLGLLIGGLIL